ncbi:hypothetical protein Ndes2526B_g07760 [Nannochloris sp. 'desiccata']
MHPLPQVTTECLPTTARTVPPRRGCSIRDVPRGYTVRIIAKSARLSSPAHGSSKSAGNKKTTTHHQLRRPPSNTSGNIAPLERVRPPTRENGTLYSEEGSLDSVELEKKEEEKLGVMAPPTVSPTTSRGTQLMKLNAVPLEMLSPVLSKDAFQQEQRQGQQKQPRAVLSFPGSDGRQITELIVGRLALCGLFGTLLVFFFTGQTLPQQIVAYPDNIFLVSIAVLSASFAVENTRTSEEGENNKEIRLQFLPALSSIYVEEWIGRVAMLGFGSFFAWQLLFSSS